MKKITSSATLGGAPFTKEDMRTVFNDEIWSAMQAMLSPFNADTEGIIVSGCVVSGGGPYDISAGIVYLDGEFMRLPAATGQTLPKYIAAAAAVNDARTFADGTNNTLFITKAAELVGSAPGTQYVAITTATDPDDRRFKRPVFLDSGTLSTKIVAIPSWNMDTTATHAVAHGLTSMTQMRSVQVFINSNAGNFLPLTSVDASDALNGGVEIMDNSNVTLRRRTGGTFDSALYNAATGYIVIQYVP